jgi:dCTP deaminase
MQPLESLGLQVMSIGFLVDSDQPMVWRGPMVTSALNQLLTQTRWRDLDYLIVDMPPGTGDIQLTLSQQVPVSGAVIVTTPQDIAAIDARKGLTMFRKVSIPVLGVVENMSTHVCTACGHEDRIFGVGAGERIAGDRRGRTGFDGRGRFSRGGTSHGGRTRGTGTRLQREISENRHRGQLMSIKSDRWIRRMALEHRMLEPFEPQQVRELNGRRIVSYGTSSYGYDVRCADEFKIFTNINSAIVDPKAFDANSFVDLKSSVCVIPPNSFALARTVEYFRIPRNVLTICLGKSTYARCGIIVNVTPLEPEWEGHVTLEFSNTTTLPAKIYANEGIAQMLFLESDEECETSYADRGGKYQGQMGVTLPKA